MTKVARPRKEREFYNRCRAEFFPLGASTQMVSQNRSSAVFGRCRLNIPGF
jgi:hypothetical protein